MKIKNASAVSLVSALAFISQAQQSKGAGTCSPPCTAIEICVGGHCIPIALAKPDGASEIDTKACSVFGDNVTCELKANRITMPMEKFETLIK